MAGFTFTRSVQAPPAQVFSVFSDLESAPERIAGITAIELLTPPPVGQGTRWKETRTIFNRDCTEELEITRFEPATGYTAECQSCGAWFSSTFDFTPDGAGTRVTVTVDCRPLTLMAKLMSPLSRLMMSSCRKATEQDIDDLIRYLETPPAAQAPTDPEAVSSLRPPA